MRTQKNNVHCFVAGRSGGHLVPALTLARRARTKDAAAQILFFSTSTHLDKQITGAAQDIDWHVPLTLGNVPYKQWYRLPLFSFQLVRSFFSALKQLRAKKPTKVVSTGGYISIPVCCAAKLLHIPIELFELNVVPGRATQFLAPLATTINICFEETRQFLPEYKCTLTAYPQRYDLTTLNLSRTQAHQQLGLNPNKQTILVLGGSQGSLFINNVIKKWISENKSGKPIQIIHQTGALDRTDWITWYKNRNVPAITAPFFDNLHTLYTACDLVVCRAGAGSLFETVFFKKPCITIPLETQTNTHQVNNALSMQQRYPTLVTVVRQQQILNDPQAFYQKLFTKNIGQKRERQRF